MGQRAITVIGSLNIDLVTTTVRIPAGGETLTASSFSTGSGGKGANQAVACARLSRHKPSAAGICSSSPSTSDVSVKMVGAVGSDQFGPHLISDLKGDGIDTSGISVEESQMTGVAVILVEEHSGENRILLNPGANYTLEAERFSSILSLGAEKPDMVVLQLEIPHETVFAILKTAKKANIVVLLNPAPAVKLPDEVFQNLDHLVLNETEAAILLANSGLDLNRAQVDWGLVTDSFLRKGVKNVIVTLGARGAYASAKLGGGKMIYAEKNIKVVDTTAAGDTFVGAYAVEATKHMGGCGWDIGRAAEWACKAAGRTVEKKGAQSAIPWADEVDRNR